MRAQPRTVFLTGASSGIGHDLALEYARRGAHVAIAARRREPLEKLASAMEKAGGRALVVPLDVCDAAAVKEALMTSERALGSLDMVIANAGAGMSGHGTRLTFDTIDEIIDVNIRGAFATLVAAIPIFMLQRRGQLVGVSSLAGRRGLPAAGAYSASKAALSTFLETLRVDLAPSGIRVTDVQPGFVATPMTEKNRHPMPFKWTSEKAARVIADRLERAPAVVAFPWPLVLATGLARHLPAWLYDRVMRASSGS